MNIAIIGTAGIPSKYGGFETLAEYLTKELGCKFNINVYCSSRFYKTKITHYNNSRLFYIPLHANGIQSIPYDIWSLFSAAKNNDVILILGVSGCVILPFFKLIYPKKKLIINIDGIEHKREKWSCFVKKFLRFSEKIAVHYGNVVISDNKEIKRYVRKEYDKDSIFIPYGSNHVKKAVLTNTIKDIYSIDEKYAFKVCRIEPENNVKMILKTFSRLNFQLIIVGNWSTSKYGRDLKKDFSEYSNIKLIDAIYDPDVLNQIRSNCAIYIHGHSAGGTNPSLVEAMYLSLPIFAFDVSYNKSTTFNQALYFKNSDELIELLNRTDEIELLELGRNMEHIAKNHYTWELIAKEYENIFLSK